MKKDLVVLGGGPGGYVAAIRAAQLGAEVCVVEMDRLGGTCLNRGCIPTKTLYRNAEILNIFKNSQEFGLTLEGYKIDIAAVQARKEKVVDQLVSGVEQLLKANDVEVLYGTGKITDANTVVVTTDGGTESSIETKNIIIATGSRPSVPPIPGADLEGIYSSEDILNFREIPKELTIIGGGVIGMEFAGIFSAFGSKVNVVEFLPNILAQVDTDLTKRLVVSLKKKGISVNTSTKVLSIEKNGDVYTVNCESKKGAVSFNSDALLISTGRTPAIDGSSLESLGIAFDKKGIKVDEKLETTLKGVYAIGDVNGISMLAHAASHQGLEAAEHIMGYSSKEQGKIVPGCIFIFPEIATAGVTEDEAKLKGIEYTTSKFLFGANGKALALGEAEGMVKVLADKEGKLIGVHIMGPHASDLIHEGVMAIEKGFKAEEVYSIIHAHPTLSEAFVEAVMGLDGKAIHQVPSKKR